MQKLPTAGQATQIKYFDTFETVDASAATVGVNIYGNELNNIIEGGSGKDTLDGGDGNDILTGGKGNDIFVYSGGADEITDYGTGTDSIMVALDDTSIIDVETKGKDIVYYFADNGTLTVTGGAGKTITVMDADKKKITPPKKNVAENLWFMEDDFAACDLDSITEQKFEVTNFETANYNFEQQQNILTYGEDK